MTHGCIRQKVAVAEKSVGGRRFLLISLDTSYIAMIDSRLSYFCCRPTRRSVKNFTRKKTHSHITTGAFSKDPLSDRLTYGHLMGIPGHLPLLLLICAFSLVFWRNTFFVQSLMSFSPDSEPEIKNEDESLCFFLRPLQVINEAKDVFYLIVCARARVLTVYRKSTTVKTNFDTYMGRYIYIYIYLCIYTVYIYFKLDENSYDVFVSILFL